MNQFPGRAKLSHLFLIAALAALGAAHSQSTGPVESKGLSTKSLGSIDLSAEIEGLAGRQLRARLATVEPGGHIAAHSHKDRPTLEYVMQGNVIEVRNGVEIAHGPGEMVLATRDVTHWWENRGTVPVVLLPVDIYHP